MAQRTAQNFLSQLNRWIAPLKKRVSVMVSKALVSAVTDTGGLQLVQISVLKDELEDNVERLQNYGFTSSPKTGSEAIVLFIGGNTDHGVVIAVDDSRYRLKLQDGEVAVYDHNGSSIVMKSSGDVEVTSVGTFKVNGTNLTVDN